MKALAVDYDRTLTNMDLVLEERALEALATARESGLKVIAISGRDLPFLQREIGHAVDLVVAENGCILHTPGGAHPPSLTHDAPAVDLEGVLACLNLPIEYGNVIASADIEHLPLVQETLQAAGYDLDLIPNRDRFMILPQGIDKAAGLLAALKILGTPLRQTAAAGDGENDVPMLRESGYGIAVANAVPQLKAVADYITSREGGLGIAEWIEQEWMKGR